MDEDEYRRLYRLAAHDNNRAVHVLASRRPDDLRLAAESLSCTTGSVLIVTGYTILSATPPTAETDGPLGAALLGCLLHLLGTDVRLATDNHNVDIVRAAVDCGLRGVGRGPADFQVTAHGADLDALTVLDGIDRLVFIERAGPSKDGHLRNMNGYDIDAWNAPLHRLLDEFDGVSIGIGDGGNEVGMGAFGLPELEALVRPSSIVCTQATTYAIVAGTSNWGAHALALALARTGPEFPQNGTDDLFSEVWSRSVLDAMNAAGAVDGMTAAVAPRIDGLQWPEYWRTVERMNAVADPLTGPLADQSP